MDIETSEQLAFIPEQVESILMTVIDGILRTEVYVEEKVGIPRMIRVAVSCCSRFIYTLGDTQDNFGGPLLCYL